MGTEDVDVGLLSPGGLPDPGTGEDREPVRTDVLKTGKAALHVPPSLTHLGFLASNLKSVHMS